VSLAFHSALLMVFAMVTWVIPAADKPERALLLGPDVPGFEDSDESRGSGGGTDGPGETAVPTGAESNQAPTAVPAPTPAPLDEAMKGLESPNLDAESGNVGANPADGLISSLVDQLESGGPKGLGIGEGLPGAGTGFGEAVGRMRRKGLDVVLVLDATDSMSPYIDQAKVRLNDIISVVHGLVPGSRFGVVAFKDYGDDYGANATRMLKLTDKLEDVRAFLERTAAGGGGATPEPTHEALEAATGGAVGWRPSRSRVIILVSDAPVHATGRPRAFALAKRFARDRDAAINVIDVGGAPGSEQQGNRTGILPDLQRIADDGGGSAFLLRDADRFWVHLIISIFGERYAQDVEAIVQKYTRRQAD
jgi:Mg-chelatase subunit ChlD